MKSFKGIAVYAIAGIALIFLLGIGWTPVCGGILIALAGIGAVASAYVLIRAWRRL